MKKLLLLIFLLIAGIIGFQSCEEEEPIELEGSIFVKVYKNSELVPDVEITTEPATSLAVTDGTGAAFLTDIPVNGYRVDASHPTLGNGSASVNVLPSSVMDVIINLPDSEDEAPIANIQSPVTNSNFNFGQEINFSAFVDDEEDAAESLDVTWFSNIDGVINEIPASSSGISNFKSSTLSAGDHVISLVVKDSKNNSSSDEINISILKDAPIANILTPNDQSTLLLGEDIEFSGTVNDLEDPNNTLQIEWSSSIDGIFNTNPANISGSTTFSIDNLSEGEHLIVLKVKDSDDFESSDQITITIVEDIPTAEILSPSNFTEFNFGSDINFSGIVSDIKDPLNSLQIEWSSDIDGVLNVQSANPNGETDFSIGSLTEGQHEITLKVTDSDNLVSTDMITVIISEDVPEATIQSPNNNDSFLDGESINFTGVVSDFKDLLPSLSIEWTSSIDGVINTDAATSEGNTSFVISDLSNGEHVITLKVTDSDNLESTDQISISVVEDIPTATIVSPQNNSAFDSGVLVTFSGNVNDQKDALNTLSVEWSSDIDGVLNTDAANASGVTTFNAALSVGLHTITLKVTDSDNLESTDQISIEAIKIVQPVVLDPLNTTNQGIDLNWSISDELDFTSYRILRSSSSNSNFMVIDVISDINTTTYSDLNLPYGETYSYQVVVVTNTGAESFSNIESAFFDGVNINLGVNIVRMVIDPERPYIYACDRINNSLLFINTDTKVVEKTIFVGSAPSDVAINLDNSKAYVANFGSTLISVIDLDSQTKIDDLIVDTQSGTWDGNPYRIACLTGDRLVFTSEDQWNNLKLIDATTGSTLSTTGSIYYPGLLTNSLGTVLYVTESGSTGSATLRYNLEGDELIEVDESNGGSSFGRRDGAISADDNYVFHRRRKYLANNLNAELGLFTEDIVACNADGSIAIGEENIWDAETFSIIKPLPISSEILRLDIDENTIYIYDNNSSKIYITTVE